MTDTTARPSLEVLRELLTQVKATGYALSEIERIWNDNKLGDEAWTPETGYPFRLSLDEQVAEVWRWVEKIEAEIKQKVNGPDSARYVQAARDAIDQTSEFKVRRYVTRFCLECGAQAERGGSQDFYRDHVTYKGFVLIGCEGYFQIDPNVLGIDAPNWDDWLDSSKIPAVPVTETQAINFLWWCERAIGGGFHPDTPGSDYGHPHDGNLYNWIPLWNAEQAARFDAGVEAVFALVEDPYEVSVAACDFLHPALRA